MTIRVWPQAVASARVAHATCQPHPCPCCHRVSLNSRAVRAVNLHDETELCASVAIDCTYHGHRKCSFSGPGHCRLDGFRTGHSHGMCRLTPSRHVSATMMLTTGTASNLHALDRSIAWAYCTTIQDQRDQHAKPCAAVVDAFVQAPYHGARAEQPAERGLALA